MCLSLDFDGNLNVSIVNLRQILFNVQLTTTLAYIYAWSSICNCNILNVSKYKWGWVYIQTYISFTAIVPFDFITQPFYNIAFTYIHLYTLTKSIRVSVVHV